MQQNGRNDPCPCGSGKKLKKCCSAPKTAKNLASRVSLKTGASSFFAKHIAGVPLSEASIIGKVNRMDASLTK